MRKFAHPYDRNVAYSKFIYESSRSTPWGFNHGFISSHTSEVTTDFQKLGKSCTLRGGTYLKQGRVSVTLDSERESSATVWLFDETTICSGCNTATHHLKHNELVSHFNVHKKSPQRTSEETRLSQRCGLFMDKMLSNGWALGQIILHTVNTFSLQESASNLTIIIKSRSKSPTSCAHVVIPSLISSSVCAQMFKNLSLWRFNSRASWKPAEVWTTRRGFE